MFQANYKKQLQRAYQNHTLVPFVGSGLSVPFQMPNWRYLLKDIILEYNTYPVDKDKFYCALDSYQYLDAIDCIINAGVDELDLQRSVARLVKIRLDDISNIQTDNNYIDLSKAKCSKYITTNYDNLLSDYIGQPPRRIETLGEDFVNEWDSGHYNNFVFNIHGDYTNPASIILSRNSYRNLYSDEKYKDILELFKYKYTFLFMGFSMDDEFIQGIFSRESSSFLTRHYIILPNVDEEKRKSIEKRFSVRVISYDAKVKEDYVKEVRHILEEIQRSREDNSLHILKTSQINEDTGLLSVNGTMDYEQIDYLKKIDEIEVLLKKQSYSVALAKYLLLQSELFGFELSNDINLRIYKGLLTCRIALRKYDEVQRMLPQMNMFEKGSFETVLYPILIDFFMNTGRHTEAYNSIYECFKKDPSNVIYIGMLHYINAIKNDNKWEDVKKNFVDNNWRLIITAEGEAIEDDIDKAYLFRVLGEIALLRKEYLMDAKQAFKKSLDYNESIEVLEDLGLVMYSIALVEADDGQVIKIEKINQKELKEAINYFDKALNKAEDYNMVLSRVAPILLRSLFYIGNYGRFDDMLELCSPYLYDDIVEISRMQALVYVALGKSPQKTLAFISDEDKRAITYQAQFKDGDYQEILAYGDNNIEDLTESDYYAVLDAAFFSGALDKYNNYYYSFIEKFPNTRNKLVIEAFKHEINGKLKEAERCFIEFAKIESPMSINILLGFYRRRGNHNAINTTYNNILENEVKNEKINYDGFYFSYHEYLMSNDYREEAVWLYINYGKDKLSIDIDHAVLIDLKIYLHDGNDLIVYCLEMDAASHKYGEKIYNYYAAIGYLMESDLINARRYIDKYKKDGYTDDRSIQLIKEFEARLLVLEGKVDPFSPGGINIIKYNVERILEPNNMIRIHPDLHGCCIMDSTSLYFYIYRGMTHELDLLKNIIVSHSSIELLQFAFMETGDKILLEVLKYIIESGNVIISSPSIKQYANIRKCFKFDSNDVAILSMTASISLALDNECGYISAFKIFEGLPDTIYAYQYDLLKKTMQTNLKNIDKQIEI